MRSGLNDVFGGLVPHRQRFLAHTRKNLGGQKIIDTGIMIRGRRLVPLGNRVSEFLGVLMRNLERFWIEWKKS
jgi:hypothetical protein